jgi:hypothetical protein
LPPCFKVTKHPEFGKIYFEVTKTKFKPDPSEFQQVHFPKTNLTDRTFGIIHPKIHSDIAYTIAQNWDDVVNCIFHDDNLVCSYSFPIPVDDKNIGEIGNLRSGRMIYEWIEMAENDLASIAFQYKYLITTDIKNFYPSIYTHSIPWAIHGKDYIRNQKCSNNHPNRYNYSLFGNCLDKLFQNAIESILRSEFGKKHTEPIVEHLENFLRELRSKETDHSYLISWIVYFIRSNNLEPELKEKSDSFASFTNPIVKAIHEDLQTFFSDCNEFQLFSDVATVSQKVTLLEHLDVFNPQ